MSSSGVGVQSKKIRVHILKGRAEAVDSVKGLLAYVVEKPFAAVAALWIVCFPLMYFALYGDLLQSARTLSGMTFTFLLFLMTFILVMLAVSYLITYAVRFRSRHYSGQASERRRQ